MPLTGVQLDTATGLLVTGGISAGDTQPSDRSFKAWNYDSVLVAGSTTTTTGTVWLLRAPLRSPQTISSINLYVATAGATLTSGRNWAGIYDASGNQLAVTADQTTAWASAGLKTMALTSPLSLTAGYYYVAIVAAATTTPAFGRTSTLNATLYNGNGAPATYSFATNGTGQNTLPASVTPSSNTAQNVAFWCALS